MRSSSANAKVTLAGLRREIKKINRRLRRITSRKGKLWDRLSVDKTSFLYDLWGRCPHKEAIMGKRALAPRPGDLEIHKIDVCMCRECGVDVIVLSGKYGVLAKARKTRMSEGAFMLECLEIIERNGISL